ncbi:hypothetical protein GCM10027088_62800 [Nocardia goodfellowii]
MWLRLPQPTRCYDLTDPLACPRRPIRRQLFEIPEIRIVRRIIEIRTRRSPFKGRWSQRLPGEHGSTPTPLPVAPSYSS